MEEMKLVSLGRNERMKRGDGLKSERSVWSYHGIVIPTIQEMIQPQEDKRGTILQELNR